MLWGNSRHTQSTKNYFSAFFVSRWINLEMTIISLLSWCLFNNIKWKGWSSWRYSSSSQQVWPPLRPPWPQTTTNSGCRSHKWFQLVTQAPSTSYFVSLRSQTYLLLPPSSLKCFLVMALLPIFHQSWRWSLVEQQSHSSGLHLV